MARNLFRQLLFPLALGAALSSAAFLLLSFDVMGRLYDEANERALVGTASALAATLPRGEGLAPWTLRVGRASGLRLTLIAADGSVLADSSAEAASMENHAARAEVASALAGKASAAKRKSATTGHSLLYAAAPIAAGTPAPAALWGGALRVAADLPALESRLGLSRWALFLCAAGVFAAACAAAAALSRRIARPLSRLSAAAAGWASLEPGERAARGSSPSFAALAPRGPEEVRVLAQGLEAMARELAEEVDAEKAARRELAALLDAMGEAVLAVDGEESIIAANPAAAALFGPAGPESLLGKALLAATRSTELEALAAASAASAAPREAELALYAKGEAWYQVFAAPFPARTGKQGTVLVLNDITRLRRLERVRRDFVANVSHELRTPIQLIKGFTETLREGEGLDPAERRRYLEIVERNAARMESLIEDLLSLARLEQDGKSWLKRESLEVAALAEEAVQAVAAKAEAKGIRIEADASAGLRAFANGGLVVEAIVNLLDNALKYSPSGTTVRVRARPAPGGRVSVEVQDEGMGIPKKELPRLFERFYRVDKARSRELGGTGLGLSIVRHIALAHGGDVEVESWEGEGSRFTILLPAAEEKLSETDEGTGAGRPGPRA